MDSQPGSHLLGGFETLLIDVGVRPQDLLELFLTAVDGVLHELQTWHIVESLHAVLKELTEPWATLWNRAFLLSTGDPIP